MNLFSKGHSEMSGSFILQKSGVLPTADSLYATREYPF